MGTECLEIVPMMLAAFSSSPDVVDVQVISAFALHTAMPISAQNRQAGFSPFRLFWGCVSFPEFGECGVWE